MQKSLTSYLARLKKEKLKRLETYAIAGKMNASYISKVVYKLTKGQKKLSQGSNATPCLSLGPSGLPCKIDADLW